MGRFYKSSKPEYLDFVYKQPNNLLLKAVEKAEQGVDKNLATVGDLYGRLKSEALKPDTKRRDDIIDGYKKQIDAMSQAIFQNPLEYRGYTPDIKALSDDISDNLQRGELAAFSSNVATRKTFSDKLDAQIKAKEISRDEANQQLTNYDLDFDNKKGSLYSGPAKYQSYSTGYLAPTIDDPYKYMDDKFTGWKANMETNKGWKFEWDNSGNRYIVTKSGGREIVTREEIERNAENFILTDKKLNSYLDTREQQGILGFDNLRNQALKQGLTNFMVDKHAYTKDTRSESVKVDAAQQADKKYNRDNIVSNVDVVTGTTTVSNATSKDPVESFDNNQIFNFDLNQISDALKNTSILPDISNKIKTQELDAAFGKGNWELNPNYDPNLLGIGQGGMTDKQALKGEYLITIDGKTYGSDQNLPGNYNETFDNAEEGINNKVANSKAAIDMMIGAYNTTGDPKAINKFIETNSYGLDAGTIEGLKNYVINNSPEKIIQNTNYNNAYNANLNLANQMTPETRGGISAEDFAKIKTQKDNSYTTNIVEEQNVDDIIPTQYRVALRKSLDEMDKNKQTYMFNPSSRIYSIKDGVYNPNIRAANAGLADIIGNSNAGIEELIKRIEDVKKPLTSMQKNSIRLDLMDTKEYQKAKPENRDKMLQEAYKNYEGEIVRQEVPDYYTVELGGNKFRMETDDINISYSPIPNMPIDSYKLVQNVTFTPITEDGVSGKPQSFSIVRSGKGINFKNKVIQQAITNSPKVLENRVESLLKSAENNTSNNGSNQLVQLQGSNVAVRWDGSKYNYSIGNTALTREQARGQLFNTLNPSAFSE